MADEFNFIIEMDISCVLFPLNEKTSLLQVDTAVID